MVLPAGRAPCSGRSGLDWRPQGARPMRAGQLAGSRPPEPLRRQAHGAAASNLFTRSRRRRAPRAALLAVRQVQVPLRVDKGLVVNALHAAFSITAWSWSSPVPGALHVASVAPPRQPQPRCSRAPLYTRPPTILQSTNAFTTRQTSVGAVRWRHSGRSGSQPLTEPPQWFERPSARLDAHRRRNVGRGCCNCPLLLGQLRRSIKLLGLNNSSLQ